MMSTRLLLLYEFIWAMHWLALHHKTQARDYCYQPAFVKTNWSDSPPRYIVHMNFTDRGSFSVITTVNDVIAVPISRMVLTQTKGNGYTNVLYNATTKLCELRQMIDRVPMFNLIAYRVLRTSNYTFRCPLERGVYAINEFKVRNSNPLLATIYNPKTRIIFTGGMFEELPDKSLRKLNVYEIVMRIVRKTCR